MHELFLAVDMGLMDMVTRDDIGTMGTYNLAHAAFANFSLHARVCGMQCAIDNQYDALKQAIKAVGVDKFERRFSI